MKRYTFNSFHRLLIASLVLAFGSCTGEDFWDTFDRTVDGPIDFTVGVEGSPARRAFTRAADENNQTQTPAASESYYALQGGTQLRLKVDGVWKRTSETGLVTKQATCKTEASETAVNTLNYDEGQTLYWDDYGTGDPENAENKANGLKVLAVAVDGKSDAPAIAEGEWERKTWTVVTDGNDVLSGDILVSNNLTAYKFAERNEADAKKLIFKHPLSKITFNIKAGQGFANGFEKDPVLTLSKANTLEGVKDAANNYALTSGTVNISNAEAKNDGTKATIVAGTTSDASEKVNVVKKAIVYPGTQLGADDNAIIGVLQADDNVYYIKAKEIHDKMTEHTNYETKPGYNYIINITVNKTGIRATASVVDWNKVESDEAYPEINVSSKIGITSGTAPSFASYDFWRSEEINKDYQHEATPTVGTDGATTFGEQTLYWPSHDTHYHLRGIYPTNTAVTTDTDGNQVVAVENGAYSVSTFPSNFVMGMPEFGESESDYMCNNGDHTPVDMREKGICARTSLINLNFRYMMSQVEVNLTSKSDDSNAIVDLTNAEVELVSVGTKGNILLSDRSALVTEEGSFTLPHTTGNNYHGVIIPQTLVNGDSNKVKFKITVYADAQKTKKSVYYADVAPIKVKVVGSTDAAKATDAWQSGVHYVYNLNITKTQINATATLTDWATVAASEEVWF